MLVLFEKIPNDFSVEGFDCHTLTVDDILDPELVNNLKDYTARFEELTEEELRNYIIIQNKLLNQLGAYEAAEENSPELAYLIPIKPKKTKKVSVRNKQPKIGSRRALGL